MGASVWRVGRTAEDRLMWRTGWGLVFGECDEQQKIGWCGGMGASDVEDWMGASVWRVGRTAEDILGEVCGGLDVGKCLESATNSRRSADVEDWMGARGQCCLESATNSRRSADVEDWIGASVWRVRRTAEDRLMWRTGWGLVSGECDEQQKIGWCGGLDGG